MVLPAVAWGVFLLGTRLAASQAGKAAAKYVVRKLGGKAAQQLGNPVSSHRSIDAAKNAVQKFTNAAGRASSKRKYGATVAAYDLSHPEVIELAKEGGRAAKKYVPDFVKKAMQDKKKRDDMVKKAKYKHGGRVIKKNYTKKGRK